MRSTWTALTDAQLLAQCEVDTYRASGPGGQKRNKTSSAVRLRHPPSGLIVIAEESRSQHENKAKALAGSAGPCTWTSANRLPTGPRRPPGLRPGPRRRRPAAPARPRTPGSGRPPASCWTCWPRVEARVGDAAERAGHLDRQPDRLPPDRPETLAGGQPAAGPVRAKAVKIVGCVKSLTPAPIRDVPSLLLLLDRRAAPGRQRRAGAAGAACLAPRAGRGHPRDADRGAAAAHLGRLPPAS